MRSKPGDELTVRHQPPAESILELRQLTKRFGDFVAVDGITLRVAAGEFLTLLGASGSGKTTTLRMIAGFEQPSSGDIVMEGAPITALPPYQRDINTVFQHYALFPHMSVRENIEYGLRMRRVPSPEREQRIREALRMVRLDDLGSRSPRQLSCGQQQRVALARALVNQPRVLLLDEPLGALDLKLRQAMQIELKEIQQRVGFTFVYVTHDQDEALTMSDRLAVFNNGRIEQIGTPAEVYESPATGFVAGFVGTSNVLENEAAEAITGSSEPITIRPEKIHLDGDGAKIDGQTCTATGHVREVVYLGAFTRYIIELDVGGELVVMQQNLTTSSMEALQVRGKSVRLVWDRRFNRRVDGGAPTGTGSSDPEEGDA